MKLFKQAPKLDKDFYNREVYAQPIHHSQNNQTPRLYLVAGLVRYLKDRYDIKSITDVGCGDGGLFSIIHDFKSEYIGIDLAEANINYARDQFSDKPNVEFVHEDFTQHPINQTDLVICCETLEHLVDPVKLLKSLPTKFLIASVPMNETKRKHGKYHLWAWDETEFRGLVKNCGYKIIHTARANQRTQIVLAEKL